MENINCGWLFENRVLRRIFVPKMEILGRFRNLHVENLYFSPNIIRVIKSRKMRLVWQGQIRNAGKSWVGKL
jgi:hypothetical protein